VRKQWTWAECCPCPCCPNDWEHYGVMFEQEVKPDYKMLLMALSVFIHVRFFDHPAANVNQHVKQGGKEGEVLAMATSKSAASMKNRASSKSMHGSSTAESSDALKKTKKSSTKSLTASRAGGSFSARSGGASPRSPRSPRGAAA